MIRDALFIVNPISGKGRKKKRIIKGLQKAGCKIVYTEYAGHAEKLAREASESIVAAVGGDGTLNEVARGLLGTDKTLALIPCGSGDGLARHLGIRGSLKHELKVIEDGNVEYLDCAEIDGRPFFSVSGVGLDAIVSERFAKAGKRGVTTYITEAVKTWRGFKPEHYTIVVDGQVIETDAVLITVANSNQWGNGAKITPLASTHDGLLDISVLDMFHTWELPVLVWHLMTGSADRSRRLKCYKGKDIRISRPCEGPAHCDGDYIPASDAVSVRILDQRLKILVPRKK